MSTANELFCEMIGKYGNVEGISLRAKGEDLNVLLENPRLIVWPMLSKNNQDDAVRFLLREHPDKIDWSAFSANSNDIAINYLMFNPDKIDKRAVRFNTNRKVVNLVHINTYTDEEKAELKRKRELHLMQLKEEQKQFDDFLSKSRIMNRDDDSESDSDEEN